MGSTTPELALPTLPTGHRFSWRWIHVGVAALAMVATLPGRTHGLGLFTEPILRSLSLDRGSYALANLVATLLGGLFCIPCGWLIDRIGTRAVLVGVTAALGATVIAMSRMTGAGATQLPFSINLPPVMSLDAPVFMFDLFLGLLLTRGLGQSALSVASLSLIGRSAARRTGLAMGIYACLTSIGFIGAFGALRALIPRYPDEWRAMWAGIGIAVLIAGLLMLLLIRNRELDGKIQKPGDLGGDGHTLFQALASPAFWAFALATSYYGMVVGGTSLFNESILAERGFRKEVFLNVTVIGIPVGLAANLLCGWAATRFSLRRLLGGAVGLFAAALAWFPFIRTEEAVYAYAIALAAARGAITVCFFSVWRRAYGTDHLGRIQGAAQLLTVVFSAFGPMLFASVKTGLGEYAPLFPVLAGISAVLALFCWFAPMPAGATSSEKEKP